MPRTDRAGQKLRALRFALQRTIETSAIAAPSSAPVLTADLLNVAGECLALSTGMVGLALDADMAREILRARRE